MNRAFVIKDSQTKQNKTKKNKDRKEHDFIKSNNLSTTESKKHKKRTHTINSYKKTVLGT